MKLSALLSLMPLLALAAPTQDSTEVASRSRLVALPFLFSKVIAALPPPRTMPLYRVTLVSLNPQIKNPDFIYPGDLIRLPATTAYVVRSGDTLGQIAERFVRSSAAGITAETKISYLQLAALNHIANPDVIVPGQRIFLPQNSAYIVRNLDRGHGDTLTRIAEQFVTTLGVIN